MLSDDLALVGLSRSAADLLSDVLLRPGGDAGVPEDTPGVDELLGHGLAVREPASSRIVATAPHRALSMLISRQRAVLLDQDQQLLEVLATADELQSRYDDMVSTGQPGAMLEILRGLPSVIAAISHAISTARRRVRAITIGSPEGQEITLNPVDVEALERGIDYQCLYASSYFTYPGALDIVRTLGELGEQQRTRDRLPSVMIIIDDEQVFLPIAATARAGDGAAVVRASVVVKTCNALFEELWSSSAPVRLDGDEVVRAADAEDVAALLMAGVKDEAIARQLRTSVRTVRRRISTLMTELGAGTRTQLGAQLARRYAARDAD